MKKRYTVLLLAFFLIAFLIVVLNLINKFTLKRVIIVSGNTNIKGINIFNRLNLLTLNLDFLEKNIIKSNPYYKKVLIQKDFPDTLYIRTEERKPFFTLVADSGKKNVDDEGVFLDNDMSDLVAVEAKESDFELYNNRDWRIVKSIDIIREFSKNNLIIDKITMNNKESVFKTYIKPKSEVTFPFTSDIPTIAASLQVIMQRFRIEGKTVTKIDFRFDKPVIVLSNGEKISPSSL